MRRSLRRRRFAFARRSGLSRCQWARGHYLYASYDARHSGNADLQQHDRDKHDGELEYGGGRIDI
jgi:hypothetical protein